MSITIKAIATETGLSVPTVGNILGQSGGRYSPHTRQRVLRAAQQLGYKPNSSARAMRSGKAGCAALVLSRGHESVVSHIPVGLLDGLDDELARHNMHLTVSRLTDDQLSREDVLPKVLREYLADGMIVNYTHQFPRRMLDLIDAHHTPAVWLNTRMPQDCVYPDEVGGAQQATAALIQLGHRRIALVHLISPRVFDGVPFEQADGRFHFSVSDRAAGYGRAMRLAGLSPRVVYQDRFVADAEHVSTCVALLSGADRPTAVLLYSENVLPAVLMAAAARGLAIPSDLSVVMFYPIEPSIAGMQISVAPIPTHELGRCSVRMLLRKIQSPQQPCDPEVVAYGPVTRATIAPPA